MDIQRDLSVGQQQTGIPSQVSEPANTVSLSQAQLGQRNLPTSYEVAKNINLNNNEAAYGHLSNKELKKKIFLFRLMSSPLTSKIGQLALPLLAKIPLLQEIPKMTIFHQFCGGETIIEAMENSAALFKRGISSTIDYSVEGEHSESSYDKTTEELIRGIVAAKEAKGVAFCAVKITGIGSSHILEKIQKGESLSSPERASYKKILERVDSIGKAATKADVRVFIDAEESWIQDSIDVIALDAMRKYNQEKAVIFTTIQMYRHSQLRWLSSLIQSAKDDDFILGMKIVRGAYMEKERLRAEELQYKSPIQPDKKSTDWDYDQAVKMCLENIADVSVCVATHNVESSKKALSEMARNGIQPDDKRVWFGQLLGMSDTLSAGLASGGYNIAKYVPYGPLEAVVPYLLRRAKENTSVSGEVSRELQALTAEQKRRLQTR